jgi:putative membrane protein
MSELNKASESKFENELFANERTFLAWLRTSIAVMSLGFVVARFGLWLRELALQINPRVPLQHTGSSMPLGEGMIGFGALLTCVALSCCEPCNRARRNQIRPTLSVSCYNLGRHFCHCAHHLHDAFTSSN